MAIGSGLGGSLGFAKESTYGTYVAPDHFVEPNTVQIKKTKVTPQGNGLYSGKLLERSTRRVLTTKAGSGTFALDMCDKGNGLLLQGLMGSLATPVIISGSSYTQTHTLADPTGKFYTIQAGMPLTTGTVTPETWLGCSFISGEFSCGVDEILTGTFEVDVKDVTEAQTISAPSYTAGLVPFHFGLMNVKVGTFNSEASITGVRKVTVKIERPKDVGRYYAGASSLKAEPIINAPANVSFSIDFDYVDKTIFADRFVSDAATSIVFEWVGLTAISGANFPTFRITLPASFIDADPPTLDGDGVITTTISGVCQYDGANQPTITVISGEVAL